MKRISLKTWIMAIVACLIVAGTAVFLAWPKAETMPEAEAPLITAEKDITLPEGIVWNVSAGQIDPVLEKEIQRAVYESEFLKSMAKNWQEELNWGNLSIEALRMENNWAILDAGPTEVEGTEGLPLLARKIKDTWEIVGPGDEKFIQWLPLIPETLLPSNVKAFMLMRYGSD